MSEIENFEQAKRKLNELAVGLNEISRFLDVADSRISAVNSLKGAPRVLSSAPPPRPLPPPQLPASDPMPEAMTDRVLMIFQENAGKPLSPKAALVLYAGKGWPSPEDPRQFYTKIIGSIAYLTKRKKVLIRTPEGYRLK